jgi:predicted nucleic acid-binding protein
MKVQQIHVFQIDVTGFRRRWQAGGIWSAVVDQCRRAGKPIQTADAWIAASARQWGCPLVTADFRDYDAIEDLEVVPIR